MFRSLLRRSSDALSTNHPILWAARLDLALLLSAALWLFYLPLVLLSLHAGETGATLVTQNMRTAPTILMAGVAITAVLFWFSSVQKAAYRDIAPSHQRHPSIMELFIGCLLIAIPGLAIVSVIADFGATYDAFTSDRIALYLTGAVLPSAVIAPTLFLALRMPFRTVMYIVALSAFLVFLILSLMLIIKDQASATLDDEQRNAISYHLAAAVGIALLALAIMASRTTHATPRKLRIVALAIQMAPAVTLFIQGTILADVVQFMMKPRGIVNPLAAGYGLDASYMSVTIFSLLLAEWLAARWTRVNLAPK